MGQPELGRLGAAQLERLKRTREKHPDLVTQAHEQEVQREMGVLPGESWSYMRHARERVLPASQGHHGLRKTVTLLAHALDLHRTQGPEHAEAFLHQAYKAAQAAAYHPQKQWAYGWPLLGLEDPDGSARPGFTPSEHAALAAYHRDQELLQRQLESPGSSSRGYATSRSSGVFRTPWIRREGYVLCYLHCVLVALQPSGDGDLLVLWGCATRVKDGMRPSLGSEPPRVGSGSRPCGRGTRI